MSEAGLRVAVVGAGAVGVRAARQLLSGGGVDEVLVGDSNRARVEAVVESLGPGARVADTETPPGAVDAVVLSLPSGQHVEPARRAVEAGTAVVSVSDDLEEVRSLLTLDDVARRAGVSVAVGAGLCPGLSCVLTAHAATSFDAVDEIHVANVGAGGPACEEQRARALSRSSCDWIEGEWVEQRGGTGRALCFFPEPIGARDCYRAALPDPVLLRPAFPDAVRITARTAASPRARLTARLRVGGRPPREGPGGTRVEVRGRRSGAFAVEVYGVMDLPAAAAGAVAAVAATSAARHELRRSGAAGLAELVDPLAFLRDLRVRGVRAAVFEGSTASVAS
jgi:hypothetical protein